MGFHYRWITDDGLIAVRTVRQILAGHGPVFNPGERVEANTSALWTWLLAAVAWITHVDVYTVVQATGLVLAPAGLLFAVFGTRNLHRRAGVTRPLVPFGAIVLAALPPFWDFVTSGLETSLVFCWLGSSWWLLSGLPDGGRGRARAAGAVIGLGWLVRPDMALITVVLLVPLVVTVRPRWVESVQLGLAAFTVPVAYEIFRMGYYGLPVPNTALTKEASSADLAQGMTYLGDFVTPYVLWLPALVLALALPVTLPWRRLALNDRMLIGAAAFGGAAAAGYVVWIGGDFMHARMLLPGTFLLLAPVLVIPLPALRADRVTAAGLTALTGVWVWAGVCLLQLRTEQHGAVIPKSGIANERLFWISRTGDAHPTTAASYIAMVAGTQDPSKALLALEDRTTAPSQALLFYRGKDNRLITAGLNRPGVSVAIPGDILGTLGAIVPLDGVAIDLHGLSYAVGGHMEATGHRVGHKKWTGIPWIVADYTALPPGSDRDSARHALSCGGLAAVEHATRAPLTFHLFASNVLHAVDYSGLRVPNDPADAAIKLCRNQAGPLTYGAPRSPLR